jgi:hypothetical protein
MRWTMKIFTCALLATLFLALLLQTAAGAGTKKPGEGAAYRTVVEKTAGMVGDTTAHSLAAKHGLSVLNVTWEDTGRYKGSCVGPNISDMTIQVQQLDPATGKYFLTCMPVIRYPNFEDKSADIKPEDFYLLVGNEKGKPLHKVTLREFLENIRSYMSTPDSWKGNSTSLLAKRDSHVLVSAQACFLPVPQKGIAEFNPVIFNYPSCEGDPAVLTILATREGTSVTIIDNKRDAFQAGMTWGQRLFYNQKGKRASLTGKRLSDYLAGQAGDDRQGQASTPAPGKDSNLNMVLLIQVPLLQKNPMRFSNAVPCPSTESAIAGEKSRRSDVEAAVIGHGKVEGPFTEVGGLEIKRDEKYPIRVTVQFYKATSNGVVSEKDIADIAAQIGKVYAKGDYVGSLVTSGETGRPTEYDGPKFEPPDWWDVFWKRHQSNTGLTPEQTIKMLRELYGPNWKPRNEEEFDGELKKLDKGRQGK